MKRKNQILCGLILAWVLLFSILGIFLPKKEFSEAERRKLETFPKMTISSIKSGRYTKDLETYSLDHFPFRESFRRIKASTSDHVFLKKDNNGLYYEDGQLSSMEYPLREENINYAVERFAYVSGKYASEDAKVFISVIPDKNKLLAPKSGHLSLDYDAVEEMVEEKADFAEYIKISDLFETEDYFATDTHLRQENTLDVAERLATAMGGEWEADYKQKKATDDFYGVYYGQAALSVPSESMYYMESERMKDYKVYDGQNQREIPLYDLEKVEGKDPYDLYLGGPLSLVTIQNPHASSERDLVIFRDSFAATIAPLLAQNYKNVTLVDIRYIHPDYLEQFVDFENADLLFLYSTLVLNQGKTIK